MGKWRPSAAARRLGDTAEQLERLLHRDGCAIDEAVGYLCARQGHLEPDAVRRLALALPPRVPRAVQLAQVQPTTVDFDDPVEARAQADRRAARRAGLASALKRLERTDRSLVFLRYRKQLTVQHIAQREAVDPKALYRRFDRILLRLRRQLEVDGIAQL
jgi:DNA-directed RNA polymerase specialized sigma24 family protein